jgi:hypothetical protein
MLRPARITETQEDEGAAQLREGHMDISPVRVANLSGAESG